MRIQYRIPATDNLGTEVRIQYRIPATDNLGTEALKPDPEFPAHWLQVLIIGTVHLLWHPICDHRWGCSTSPGAFAAN
eukprot:COSAG02_NODE_11453_length_1721_cov_1.311961_1_plen_78_part_00